MIDTRIKTFLVLCQEMNYRKTAELLHMTQPAVTQQIHFLEKEYNCKLFNYDKRRLTMTEEAKVLQEYAENVLYQERQAIEQMRLSKGRKLSIGATKTIGEYVIAPLIVRFLKEEENQVSIEVENTEKLLSMIREGKLDFALVEGFFDRSDYACQLYREENFVGICDKNHPFAGRNVKLDELWEQHLFIREEGSGTRDIFEQILSAHNHGIADFKQVTGVGNFDLMFKLMKEFKGITFAYEAVLNENENLRKFTIKGLNVKREFNYVYLNNPFSEKIVNYFRGFE